MAKLRTESSGGSHNVQKVLFSEDKLLMENMEKSDLYKDLKKFKSSQVTNNYMFISEKMDFFIDV